MTYAETWLTGIEIPLPPEPDWLDDELATPARSDSRSSGDDAQADDLDGAVAYRMTRLRVDRMARRQLDDEERPPLRLPAVKSLDALLAEPDSPTRYRIDRLAPAGGRVMLSAQWKAGKSTVVHNLIRALADDEPFLGQFEVTSPARRLALVDDELSEGQLRRWLREQNITNTAAVPDPVSLRGKVGSFDLTDDRCRAQWATRWRDLGVDYLVFDCLRPVLDALGLDENHDAGRFLVAFDALLAEAGITDAIVVHHMGHGSERARGDSRLQDWPDAIWRVMRENDSPESARYFSAYGRDVDVREGRLTFDPATRRLSFSDGSRAGARAEAAHLAVIEVLADHALRGDRDDDGRAVGLGVNAIEDALCSQHSRKAIREGIEAAVASGAVQWERGPRKSKLHRLAHPCADCGRPVSSGRPRHESCDAEAVAA